VPPVVHAVPQQFPVPAMPQTYWAFDANGPPGARRQALPGEHAYPELQSAFTVHEVLHAVPPHLYAPQLDCAPPLLHIPLPLQSVAAVSKLNMAPSTPGG
jgi:hypothetical protein